MNESQEGPRRLLIGDLVLDTAKRQVSRHDIALPLPKLSYRLLLALAEAAPNVLTHDELLSRVWPGRIVSPETVTQRIKLTRKALGDDAHHPRYIGVVRGEGYRMLAYVKTLPPEENGVTRGVVAELNRRRVPQIALVYAVIAWIVTEVVSFLVDALPVLAGWPETPIAIAFVVGFPITMFLAWRFDIGPGGIKRTPAASTEGRTTVVAAVVLMLSATAGLLYLIYPRVLERSEISGRQSGETIAEPNTIAVLPFANASGNPQDLYISEGLGDVLRDRLGSIEGMRVAARSSSVIFREPTIDAIAIGQRLGVSRLIEGQMQKEGEQLRISIQIIDGRTGFQVWTGTFNRNARNLLAIQQDIAQEVVRRLLPERNEALAASEPASSDASAYELMLLARHYYQQVREESIVDLGTLMKSIDLYRQATLADPDSALAHSRLGAALLYLGDVEAAEGPIFRALAINPDISEVQYTLGLYRWMRYLPGSGKAHERAVELDPHNPDALEAYGKWIWVQMMTDQVEPYFIRALEIDPMSVNRYADLGNYYGMSGMRDKARAVAEQIPERFTDTNAYMIVARILELTGAIDEAIAWALRARELSPDNPEASWMVAELYARIGDFEAAHHFEGDRAFNLLYWERRYEDMIALGEELVLEQPNQIQIWYGLAHAYAATGRFEQAVHVLRSQEQPEHALSESRRANDVEALVTFADALNELGDTERALELAAWMDEMLDVMLESGGHDAWWPYLYSACTRAILGQDAVALERLEKMAGAMGLPWYPFLVDAPCFRKFASEPRYQAVVEAIDERMRKLREQLPDTLSRFQAPRR